MCDLLHKMWFYFQTLIFSRLVLLVSTHTRLRIFTVFFFCFLICFFYCYFIAATNSLSALHIRVVDFGRFFLAILNLAFFWKLELLACISKKCYYSSLMTASSDLLASCF